MSRKYRDVPGVEKVATPARVIKRNRSISLEGEKFTFTDLRKLLSEAAIDGYAEDSSVSVYSDHYAGRYSTVTISEAK